MILTTKLLDQVSDKQKPALRTRFPDVDAPHRPHVMPRESMASPPSDDPHGYRPDREEQSGDAGQIKQPHTCRA